MFESVTQITSSSFVQCYFLSRRPIHLPATAQKRGNTMAETAIALKFNKPAEKAGVKPEALTFGSLVGTRVNANGPSAIDPGKGRAFAGVFLRGSFEMTAHFRPTRHNRHGRDPS
jgi:hypothetical protein